TVPVTLNVTAAPTLSSTTPPLSFNFQVGGIPPGSQSVNVTASAGAAIPFSASASGGAWLSVGSGGTTPGSVSVSASAGSLAAGTYNGSVTITSTQASNQVVIPVTLTVSTQPSLQVTQPSLP